MSHTMGSSGMGALTVAGSNGEPMNFTANVPEDWDPKAAHDMLVATKGDILRLEEKLERILEILEGSIDE